MLGESSATCHQPDNIMFKILPNLKSTKVEEQLLTLDNKFQTGEVETPSKLEPQLIP
jgi:hypothetical protein